MGMFTKSEVEAMRIIALDPGNKETAYVIYEGGRLLRAEKVPNKLMRDMLHGYDDHRILVGSMIDHFVIEMVACYGMPVGAEVFETCAWIGVFEECARSFGIDRDSIHRMYRQDVKLHLCRSNRANDSNIRQAIIDRYGPGKDVAIGTKKKPGPLYGVSGDVWAALAVAITFNDTKLRDLTPLAAG